jgi:hypothetical protein
MNTLRQTFRREEKREATFPTETGKEQGQYLVNVKTEKGAEPCQKSST